jgi:hypothetical protein
MYMFIFWLLHRKCRLKFREEGQVLSSPLSSYPFWLRKFRLHRGWDTLRKLKPSDSSDGNRALSLSMFQTSYFYQASLVICQVTTTPYASASKLVTDTVLKSWWSTW